MAAQQKTSIYTEDNKNNGSIGMKKPGTTTFEWRPTTRNCIDQFSERNLDNTFVSTPRMSYKSATMKSPLPLQSNSKTTMQRDKVALVTLTSRVNVRNLPPIGVSVGTAADHIGKLSEKMQTTTISTKSKKTTDDGDKNWLPQMDGIDMVLPSSFLTTNQSCSSAAMSTTEHKVKMTDEMLKTEEYINSVLYGARKHKRLPVFEEICPSSMFSDTENPPLASFC